MICCICHREISADEARHCARCGKDYCAYCGKQLCDCAEPLGYYQ